ncbi:tetratricopeptide repeat protein [Lysobacter sp. D1-1-M9]|uniref:tetratricopeptide repeat protein n=1 Tax=Novilysobacter longmucuonensis TaxID=3098603 RepID=UPI002FC7845A
MQIRCFLLAVALAACGTASAQSLPRPAEFYFDEDASATRAVVAVSATGDAAVEQLLKAIERDPRAAAETAQLAHIAMAGGRPELGRELYARALRLLGTSDGLYRPVMWNYGWDLYRTGDHAAALDSWRTLLLSRNVTAQWMPQTLALVLWTLDRQDEAVQWYAAAVRTEPRQWRSSEAFASLLPTWTAEERATLAEVQAAWAENPPSW